MNIKGRKISGEITAENEVDLECRLKEIGLDMVNYREVKQAKAGFFSRIKIRDMIVFCLHMEQLYRAGVPLLDALADTRDATESPKLRDVLTNVYESVKSGNLLSQAMALYPDVFSDVFVGLIAAGEKTGSLNESFHNISEHMKWNADLRRKIKKAMTYPIVLVVVLIGVISVMMLFVVPKLMEFIISQGFHIPFHTRALMAFSKFFGDYWYLIIGLPVITFIFAGILYRTSEAFAYQIDRFVLKIPVIGGTVRKINLSRFTHFFSVMFNSGIDILDSLEAGKKVVGNRVIKDAIELVHRSVSEGNRIADSISRSSQFPNLVIRMFKVGEDSGNMSEALENINFFYNREVSDSIDSMISFIQPVMTVILGSMIFWVIAGVFGPLYESFSKMNI